MEVEEKAQIVVLQPSPDHWSVFLRCTICFGFLENPHTLICGHSFCSRCLKRLAEIARDDNPTHGLRRLFQTCPTCRHPFRARPALSGHVHTNIVLKQLVELWKRECKTMAFTSIVNFRSVGCQTTADAKSDKEGENSQQASKPQQDLQEELSTRTLLSSEYCEIVLKRMLETLDELANEASATKSGDLDLACLTTARSVTTASLDGDRDRRGDHSDDSQSSASASSSSDAHAGGTRNSPSDASLPDRLPHSGLPRLLSFTSDNCPGRLLLMSVWSIYSLVIVALAETSLPYVILFTLFFFMLVLR